MKRPWYKNGLFLVIIVLLLGGGAAYYFFIEKAQPTPAPKQEVKKVEKKPTVEKEEATETKPKKKEEVKKETKPAVKSVVDQKTFESYALLLRNGSFIKKITLEGAKAEVIFYSTYEGYKAAHDDSGVTKEQYQEKIGKNNEIEKTLVGESVRLLNKFPALNEVSMIFPYDNKIHSIDLTRQQVNTYLGLKVEELSKADQTWQLKFVERVVNNDVKRQAFAKHFVKVQ